MGDRAVVPYEATDGPHLAAVCRNAATGWRFVVEAPLGEFNAYVEAATRQSTIIALIVTVAILIVVAWVLRTSVLRGLGACVTFAAAVAKGDLDGKLALHSRDELQTLGDALQDMPDGNGLDAIGEIRRTPSSPEVIVITGWGDPDGAERAMRQGAWDYIEKPPSVKTMNGAMSPRSELRARLASTSSAF